MIISPTEPPELKRLLGGDVNMTPERYGCDIFIVARGQLIGIQRKEIKDLFASVEGGRLKTQMDMMGPLHAAYLIIEGSPRFTTNGKLMGRRYGREWTRDSYTSILISCQNRGVHVLHSADVAGTAHLCELIEAWHAKETHSLIDGARASATKLFGTSPTHREFGSHMLQGIPGVGPKVAGAIYAMFGLPLQLTVTEAQLQQVPGVGPKLAKKIWRAINGDMKPTEFVK